MLKKGWKITSIAVLGVGSFFVFLFLGFPYEILKETAAVKVSEFTGIPVQIGSLSPAFPLGIAAGDVRVRPASMSDSLKISGIKVRLGILDMLLGNFGIYVDLEGRDKGRLNLNVDVGMFELFRSGMPKYLYMKADNFALDEFVKFILGSINSPGLMPYKSTITSFGFTGKLNGQLKIKINTSDLAQSSGNVDLQIKNAALLLSHPSISLNDQNFSKALFKVEIFGGVITVDGSTGMSADEIQFGASGKILLKPQIPNSVFDLKLMIKLDKDLKDKFGFILDVAAGGVPVNGSLNLGMTGTLAQPAVKPI